MKTFLFIALLLPIFTSVLAFKQPESIPPYFVRYEKDATLIAGQAKVTFICNLYQYKDKSKQTLQYGINGSSENITMNVEGKGSLITTPQKGVFQFYYDSNYTEIITDSIELKSGMEIIITLNFKSAYFPETVSKPVIYLYPETQTDIAVVVNPNGKMTFTYPEYNNSWNVTAQPNGDLKVDGKSYRYLFWEANELLKDPFSDKTGFIVNKENTVSFLEEKLTALGLNTTEQTDFITYWGPRLVAHDQCKVKFVINEDCDTFAKLNISPTPDHINRIYMLWSTAESTEKLSEQQLPILNRDGFDVLEWGGSEIPASTLQFHASTH